MYTNCIHLYFEMFSVTVITVLKKKKSPEPDSRLLYRRQITIKDLKRCKERDWPTAEIAQEIAHKLMAKEVQNDFNLTQVTLV